MAEETSFLDVYAILLPTHVVFVYQLHVYDVGRSRDIYRLCVSCDRCCCICLVVSEVLGVFEFIKFDDINSEINVYKLDCSALHVFVYNMMSI